MRLATIYGPNNADAHEGLGTILQLTGHPDEAIIEFKKALKVSPHDAEILTKIGCLLSDKIVAVTEFNRAIEYKPDYEPAYYNLGDLLMQMDKYSEAIPVLEKAVALQPSDALAHMDLGVAYENENAISNAEHELRHAIGLQPNLTNAHYNLASLLASRALFQDAVVEYRKAIGNQSKLAVAHAGLGIALCKLRHYSEAVVELHKSIQLQPAYGRNPQILKCLAECEQDNKIRRHR